MGKINKYANLYDKQGNLLRKAGKYGLKDYTIKELSDLVDKLGTEKDENGNLKDYEGYKNAQAVLTRMLMDHKYASEREAMLKEITSRIKANKEEKDKALQDLDEELTKKEIEEKDGIPYTEFEEISNGKV